MSLRPRTTYTQNRGHKLVTAPTEEPITVNELRQALRLPEGQEEEFLQALIIEAREMIERQTGLALLTQRWRLTLDNWPQHTDVWWDGVVEGAMTELYSSGGPRWVELPQYPLQDIINVTTYNSAGDATAITVADVFDIDISSIRGRMVLKDGQVWPIALRTTNAIEIVYDAGYGDAWSDIPAGLRGALRQMAAYAYAHRGDCDTGTAFTKSGAASAVAKYAVVKL